MPDRLEWQRPMQQRKPNHSFLNVKLIKKWKLSRVDNGGIAICLRIRHLSINILPGKKEQVDHGFEPSPIAGNLTYVHRVHILAYLTAPALLTTNEMHK